MSDLAGEGCEVLVPSSERGSLAEIERSIITRYRKSLWTKFIKAIKDFQLVEDGDRIAVAVSGGKDSLLMAKLFQELQRHGKANFTVAFISMDPGYHQDIRELLVENCSFLDIPVHLFETRIFEIAGKIAQDYPCYMCAKMRRGALYAKARELGCNKLALAHHFNDVIETIMLNLFYAGTFQDHAAKAEVRPFRGVGADPPALLRGGAPYRELCQRERHLAAELCLHGGSAQDGKQALSDQGADRRVGQAIQGCR